MNNLQITQKVNEYILKEYFGDSPEELNGTTPLISSGVIDSISVLELVDFLENAFKFEFESHEIDQSYLDSVDMITDFVITKIKPKK